MMLGHDWTYFEGNTGHHAHRFSCASRHRRRSPKLTVRSRTSSLVDRTEGAEG